MAVYKSRRKDAAAQFVADARELRKATVRIARKFPASYKYVTTGPLLQLAGNFRAMQMCIRDRHNGCSWSRGNAAVNPRPCKKRPGLRIEW